MAAKADAIGDMAGLDNRLDRRYIWVCLPSRPFFDHHRS